MYFVNTIHFSHCHVREGNELLWHSVQAGCQTSWVRKVLHSWWQMKGTPLTLDLLYVLWMVEQVWVIRRWITQWCPGAGVTPTATDILLRIVCPSLWSGLPLTLIDFSLTKEATLGKILPWCQGLSLSPHLTFEICLFSPCLMLWGLMPSSSNKTQSRHWWTDYSWINKTW